MSDVDELVLLRSRLAQAEQQRDAALARADRAAELVQELAIENAALRVALEAAIEREHTPERVN